MQHNEYEGADAEMVMQPPKLSFAIIAIDALQLTVTKALLDLLSELGVVSNVFRIYYWIFNINVFKAFSLAAKQVEPQRAKGVTIDYPWCIRNDSSEALDVIDSEAFSVSRNILLKCSQLKTCFFI